jgi:2-oxoglutarate dehydrogenase E2 component (dihydrolipoamide succinyltransferase)
VIGSEAEHAAAARPAPGVAGNIELGRSATDKVADGVAVNDGTLADNVGVANNDDAGASERPTGRSFVSPVVARMAAEYNLDLTEITGTGLGGRVTKKDVDIYLRRISEEAADETIGTAPDHHAANAAADQADGTDIEQAEDEPAADAPLSQDEVLTPLTAMRRAIAQHMVMSKRTSPHVTTIFEADMTAVIRHREAHKRSFATKGIALTYTPYFVAAVVTGLRAVPEANSRFTDAGIAVNRRIHIGIAVALTHGLLVPVLHDADEKNLQGLARQVNEVVARTRSNSLRPDDVQGGTFTVTNHGTGGSLLATPIINQPQTGILGVGAIVKRPVVRTSTPSLLPNADDSIVIRPMCYLSFTFDHRVLDGAQGDAFLTAVQQRLENWQ